jgi:hypothetical protein
VVNSAVWLDTWWDNKVREIATVCLPWQRWKALVWFDYVDTWWFKSDRD